MRMSRKSEKKLQACHSDLIKLMNEVSKEESVIILSGFRGRYEQDLLYYIKQRSKKKFGESKHNLKPSRAVDASCVPYDTKNKKDMKRFGERVVEKAKELNINIHWGIDENDIYHFELVDDED